MRLSDKFLWSTCLLLVGLCFSVDAEPLPPDVNKVVNHAAQRNFQQGEQQIGRWMAENQSVHLRGEQEQETKKSSDQSLSHQCLAIKSIAIKGISLLSQKQLQQLSSLDNSCISAFAVNRLIEEITSLYVQNGFITARVLVGKLDQNKQLQLNVVEGHVEAIKGDSSPHIHLLFPNVIGKPLDLRRLEQGIDQANRLSSNNMTLDIKPGDEFGGSVIYLHNEPLHPWHLSSLLDNYGQQNTGRYRANLALGWDDLLGLDDYLNLGTTQSIKNPNQGLSRSYNMLYSIPYGYGTFSSFFSYSEYGINQFLGHYNASLSGNSHQWGSKLDYVLHRDQTQIYRSYFQFTQKKSDNVINGAPKNDSNFDYPTLELGASYFKQLAKGSMTASIAVEKGFDEKKNDFWKWFSSVGISQWFGFDGTPYQLNSNLYLQYSSDTLWGVEELNLTDPNAVRGVSKNNLSAGSGLYWQNTLSSFYVTDYGTVSPRVGMDIGGLYLRNDQTPYRGALGLSVGVNYRYQEFDLDIMLNKAFVLGNIEHEAESMQFLFQMSFAL